MKTPRVDHLVIPQVALQVTHPVLVILHPVIRRAPVILPEVDPPVTHPVLVTLLVHQVLLQDIQEVLVTHRNLEVPVIHREAVVIHRVLLGIQVTHRAVVQVILQDRTVILVVRILQVLEDLVILEQTRKVLREWMLTRLMLDILGILVKVKLQGVGILLKALDILLKVLDILLKVLDILLQVLDILASPILMVTIILVISKDILLKVAIHKDILKDILKDIHKVILKDLHLQGIILLLPPLKNLTSVIS